MVESGWIFLELSRDTPETMPFRLVILASNELLSRHNVVTVREWEAGGEHGRRAENTGKGILSRGLIGVKGKRKLRQNR